MCLMIFIFRKASIYFIGPWISGNPWFLYSPPCTSYKLYSLRTMISPTSLRIFCLTKDRAVTFCAEANRTVFPTDVWDSCWAPPQEAPVQNHKRNHRSLVKTPLCLYSSMILKLMPTPTSDWHSIMISVEEQLFCIIRFSVNNSQVVPLQLFYECVREMAGCQRQHPHGCGKQRPRHKKKEKYPSQIAMCTILTVLYILCSCAFIMLYLSKNLCKN